MMNLLSYLKLVVKVKSVLGVLEEAAVALSKCEEPHLKAIGTKIDNLLKAVGIDSK